MSGIVGEPYGVVSLESESSEKEVDGILVCIGLPNDISNHVWCIHHGDREKHVSC